MDGVIKSGKAPAVLPMQSLGHGLAVLSTLAKAVGPVGVAELADALDLHRSTVHRILATLLAYGLVRKVDKAYSIGLAAVELAQATGYHATADPIVLRIAELHRVTRGRAIFAVPRFDALMCALGSPRGDVSFPIVPRYSQLPFHSTAAGKAYLAFRPEREIEEFLRTEPFPATTSFTRTSAWQLRRGLNDVRRKGYATESREFSALGRAIAVSIRDADGLAAAAIALGVPQTVNNLSGLTTLVEAARTTADRISRDLFNR